MKTDLFQSCGHCWVVHICWHIEFSTLTASSFRIWNSSTGILSRPLALFVVMLPQAHLTSHSKMSGFMWVTTPLWLSGSLRPFLHRSSMYSCHLLLISYASVGSLLFFSFVVPIFAENFPLVSLIFLTRSLVFPSLLFSLFLCIVHLRLSYLSLFFSGSLHSVGYSFPCVVAITIIIDIWVPQLSFSPPISFSPSLSYFLSINWFSFFRKYWLIHLLVRDKLNDSYALNI